MDVIPDTTQTPVAVSAGQISAFVWLKRHSLAVFLILTAIGSLRIVSTYDVFSHTTDEPAHIACGTEWLTTGTYRFEPQHPPLARVAAALGPYLAGGYSHPLPYDSDVWLAEIGGARISIAGLVILRRDGHYDRTLTLARLGMLPFFWVASLVVYLWARRWLGEPGTALAVLLFTFLPPILAHAGLATTDMALTAFVGAAFLAACVWHERPCLSNSLLLGGLTGLALLSKFSSLAFLPVAVVSAAVWHAIAERPSASTWLPGWRRTGLLAVAMLVCVLVVWAGYRFSFGSVNFVSFRMPAPEFYQGIQDVMYHNLRGHPSYLLGQHSRFGWWYFFPIVLAVKTPLAFLALVLVGGVTAAGNRGVRIALAFSLGILAFSMTSNINLGVRHILPVYVGFSIVAAAGAQRLLVLARSVKWTGWALGGLLLWMVVTSSLSHPDYLPYFNMLAGSHPENILVDSDLDWGQDLKRLSHRLKEVGATSVAFKAFQFVDLKDLDFPALTPPDVLTPVTGWNAVSLSELKFSEGNADLRDVTPWQETIPPQEKIGKGIWLWYFPPNARISR